MNNHGRFKKITLSFVFASILFGCGGGDVSVIPSNDNFTQEGQEITAKMDILWVIDNSGSMEPYQAALEANFDSFITNFVGNDYDYRMAVIGTDAWYASPIFDAMNTTYSDITFFNNSGLCDGGAGRNVTITSNFFDGNFYDGASGHPLIVSGDPAIDFTLNNDVGDDPSDDIETIFSQNIVQGTCGPGTESGLRSMLASLQSPNNAGFGFPRSDAHLAIIVISDEEDDDDTNTPLTDYTTFLSGIASAENGYSFHTVAVLDQACLDDPSTFGGASIGQRYADLSDLTEGVKASICSPFADSLQSIAQTIIQRTVEFSLNSVPVDPNAINVSVKNPGETEFTQIFKDAENGWTYNMDRNSIIFAGTAIPAQGSEISILYDPQGL